MADGLQILLYATLAAILLAALIAMILDRFRSWPACLLSMAAGGAPLSLVISDGDLLDHEVLGALTLFGCAPLFLGAAVVFWLMKQGNYRRPVAFALSGAVAGLLFTATVWYMLSQISV